MIFEKDIIKDVTVIKVNLKKATLENTEKFREFLLGIIKNGAQKVIIDLTSCDYVDSTFLGTLVVCLKAVDCAGCTIKLVCNSKVSFIICEITHLSSVFAVHNNLDSALKEYEGN